jgi:hypothetical protein
MSETISPDSQLVNQTCKDYIDRLCERGQQVRPGDRVAVLFLAASAVDASRNQEDRRGAYRTMLDWAAQLQPESIPVVQRMFSEPSRHRAISRAVFSSIQPGGCYQSEQLIQGLRTGEIIIDW